MKTFNQVKNIEKMMATILCLYLIVFPWVLWKKELIFTEEERLLVSDSYTGILDTALYGKSFVTIVAGFILAFLLLYKHCIQKESIFFNQKRCRKINILLLGVLSIGSILSALLGGHTILALRGNVNSCEGLYVWLAYTILFLTASEIFSQKEYKVWLKRTLLLLCYITIFLTIIEFFYQPILKILFPSIWNTEYPNMTTLTLYNPGYYALFCTLLFSVASGLWISATNIHEEISTGIALYGMAFAIITSKTTGAFYVMLIEFLILFIVFLITIYQKRKKTKTLQRIICKGAITVIALLLFGIANLVSNGKFNLIATETSTNETRAIHETEYFKLTDIQIEKSTLHLIGEEHTITSEIDSEGTLCFYDENKNTIPFTEAENKLIFKGNFSLIEVWIEGNALTFNLGYRDNIHFYIYQGNFYPMLSNGCIVNDITGNVLWKQPFSRFATGRGWFWLGSLSSLQQCIFIGHGMGTFQIYFKQFDFVGLLNIHGTTELIVDKPHNLYIQTAIQSGIIATMSLIGLIFVALHNTLSHIKKSCIYTLEDKEKGFQLGLFLAVISFATLSLITDSSVTFSPLVWVFMGTACSIYQHDG